MSVRLSCCLLNKLPLVVIVYNCLLSCLLLSSYFVVFFSFHSTRMHKNPCKVTTKNANMQVKWEIILKNGDLPPSFYYFYSIYRFYFVYCFYSLYCFYPLYYFYWLFRPRRYLGEQHSSPLFSHFYRICSNTFPTHTRYIPDTYPIHTRYIRISHEYPTNTPRIFHEYPIPLPKGNYL